jgi:hypothetical protein
MIDQLSSCAWPVSFARLFVTKRAKPIAINIAPLIVARLSNRSLARRRMKSTTNRICPARRAHKYLSREDKSSLVRRHLHDAAVEIDRRRQRESTAAAHAAQR